MSQAVNGSLVPDARVIILDVGRWVIHDLKFRLINFAGHQLSCEHVEVEEFALHFNHSL